MFDATYASDVIVVSGTAVASSTIQLTVTVTASGEFLQRPRRSKKEPWKQTTIGWLRDRERKQRRTQRRQER